MFFNKPQAIIFLQFYFLGAPNDGTNPIISIISDRLLAKIYRPIKMYY